MLPVQAGLIYAAVERRYRAVLFVAGNLSRSDPVWLPEVTPANFASHTSAPKLLLNGKYDEVAPLRVRIEPLYNLLREPKRQYLYEAGHTPPLEIIVPIINDWLNETLGQVKRN